MISSARKIVLISVPVMKALTAEREEYMEQRSCRGNIAFDAVGSVSCRLWDAMETALRLVVTSRNQELAASPFRRPLGVMSATKVLYY